MIDPKKPDFSNTPVSPKRPRFDYTPVNPKAAPHVSIITPYYNSGTIIYETAASVLQQSFQQWEWLIVNDGSNDTDSISTLDYYRNLDPRVKVIDHECNRGLSAARNTGFKASACKYVVQLDSDDMLEPTAIEKWLWFLESYPEFSFCKGYSVGFGAQEYLWEKGFHNGKEFLLDNLVDPTSMIRKEVHSTVEGYDESLLQGLEDWDFWLHCASLGYWGGNIPEYLDWYRRRQSHNDRWSNWDNGKKQRVFRKKLRERYSKLWDGFFPNIQSNNNEIEPISDDLPCENLLKKDKQRILMILPWLTIGGADKFNLDLLQQLTNRNYEITIATTLHGDHSWLPYFNSYTPDIFILNHFLRLTDYPRFLRYLIHSRQVDLVMISHSELGYLLLPYLRAYFPTVPFVDFCHVEEMYWKNGGYPRMSVEYQELFDSNIVSSEYLKTWMINRGANRDKISVCYTNIDVEQWQPSEELRSKLRNELAVDERTPIILYSARICSQKQPRVFADSLIKHRGKTQNFMAIVAGDGPDLKWLQSYVIKKKLNNRVIFTGAVSNRRVLELMVASDIFFLPSKWEGISLSIYEAMACGLPIVGAHVGGQKELLTPECGILVSPSDEETEAREYSELLYRLIVDPNYRAKLGKAARERVVNYFRLDQMGERMVGVLENAIKFNRTHPSQELSKNLARVLASQAVDYANLSQKATHLSFSNESLNLRLKIFLVVKKLSEPFFLWGVDRGWTWLFPLSERVKRILLPKI
jgi:glycosyltransferase involved in cell wall biosynthesis/GT2 family glycosyltransferase